MRWLWERRVALLLGLMIAASGEARAQGEEERTGLAQLAILEGSWDGQLDGTLGPAQGRREYRFVLGGQFLHMTHDRDPNEASADAPVEEEWGVFSFDEDTGTVVLREFLVEGIVNRYRCRIGESPPLLECENEFTEGAAGMRLTLRYEVTDDDHFVETFEIFGPDRTLQVRMNGRWERSRSP